jgi:hypothetical protein
MNPGSDDNKRAQIGFESQDEKEKLISLTSSAALTSLIGAALMRRYPKWGYRYMVVNGVLAGLAALAYAMEDVE